MLQITTKILFLKKNMLNLCAHRESIPQPDWIKLIIHLIHLRGPSLNIMIGSSA